MLNISTLELEQKSVFIINSIMVILVIITFLLDIPMQYFFYFNILTTLILSYVFFKKSKKLSKYLILTNLFIFFYFLYPEVESYIMLIGGSNSYLLILLYNIFLASIFLMFSGEQGKLIKSFSKFNIKIFSLVFLISICYGIFFYYIKEPIPTFLQNLDVTSHLVELVLFSLILAISEQMIFTGFLFNLYRELNPTRESMFQVSMIFVLFHLLRFQTLVVHFYNNFGSLYILLISIYYIALFIFMNTCLYLYSFNTRKYKGNFIYSILIHFVTDFVLITFALLVLY